VLIARATRRCCPEQGVSGYLNTDVGPANDEYASLIATAAPLRRADIRFSIAVAIALGLPVRREASLEQYRNQHPRLVDTDQLQQPLILFWGPVISTVYCHCSSLDQDE
jgi:hypothetical protein